MRVQLLRKLTLTLVALVFFSSPESFAQTSSDLSGGISFARGELIIKYRDSASAAAWDESQNRSGFASLTNGNSLRDIFARHRVRHSHRLFDELDAAGDSVRSREDLLNRLRSTRGALSRSRSVQEGSVPNLHNIYRIAFDDNNTDVVTLARELEKDPNVEFAHPNFLLRLALTPNDPSYSSQWHHPNISAPAGWDLSQGSTGVVIAVVDTGVDWNHPDLAANIWTNPGETAGDGIDNDGNGYIDDVRGWDFVDVTDPAAFAPGEDIGPTDNDPMDFLGHGTMMAGAIAAVGNNSTGGSGVCWRCKIMPLRVGVTQREVQVLNGRAYVLESWVANAVAYATAKGADVINLSLVSNNWPGSLKAAVDAAYAQDVVIVASAGNDGDDSPHYPAAYDKVLGVAATDQNNQRSIWAVPQPPLYQGAASDFGAWVKVAAPGTNIFTTNYDNGYSTGSGTSISAAIVSGLAGVVRTLRPSFDNATVMRAITSTTDAANSDRYVGTGRVNLARALSLTAVPTAGISVPLAGTSIGGSSYSVIGSAGGTNFSSFTLEYGLGYAPTIWTPIRTSTAAVTNGVLGTWSLTTLQDNSPYVLRLRVTDSFGNTSRSDSLVFLQRNLVTGWPRDLGGLITGDGVTPANYDRSDSQLEVAAVSTRFVSGQSHSDLNLLNHDGSALLGFPVTDVNHWLSGPTAGDITGEGEPEILCAGYDWGFPSRTIKLHAFNKTGTEVSGWPKVFTSTEGHSFQSPSVGDLNNDGTNEIVFSSYASDLTGPSVTHLMYVYRFDGTLLPGWPKSTPLNFPVGSTTLGEQGSHAILVDLDNDNDLEIVVGVGTRPNAQIFAFHHTGSPVAGFPITVPDLYTPQIIAGDIDNDGQVELVANNGNGWVSTFERNGVQMTGWPKALAFGGAAPTLSDLDGDQDLELFFYTFGDNITAYHHTGAAVAGFPTNVTSIAGGGIWASAVTADLNGDARPEIVQMSGDDGQLFAFQFSGAQLAGWPRTLAQSSSVSPALGDLDGNSSLDLTVAYGTSIALLDLAQPYDITRIQWPNSWFDQRHSGRFVLSTIRGDLDSSGAVNVLDVQRLANIILGTETNPAIIARADLNGDGQRNAVDLQVLVNIVLGR